MICEICKKIIVKRHTIHTLFQKEMHHICEYCYQKYPLLIKQSVFPIQEGNVYWSSMIHTNEKLSPMAYMSFMKPFYVDYVKHHKHSIYLHFDQLSDTILSILDSLRLGDIYLLTLHENIDEEENEYDI